MLLDVCGFWCYEKSSLRQHVKRHMIYRELFKCDFPGCSTVLTTVFLLRYHKRVVHDGIRSFECHCGKMFKQKIVLEFHQKHVHSKLSRIQCDQCNKWLVNKQSLKLHKKVLHPSDGKKSQHPCEVCGLMLSSVMTLAGHMKLHKEPKFQCDRCEKKFFSKGAFLDHQEHHTILDFPCTHCKRSFRKDHKLKDHLKKVHFKEKTTFPCELCTSTFTRRTTYRDHVLRQHKTLKASMRTELLERISNMLPIEKTGLQVSD